MPPLPRITISAIADLAEQLRYAPRRTLLRDVERAADLAGRIDPDRVYPEDWVVFRITGYRPEIKDPAMIVGRALLGDLSALVERLSRAATMTASELAQRSAGDVLDPDALCRRWSVSRKTVDRYRRRGLIAHRVLGDDGRSRLLFTTQAVELFERRHRDTVARAGSFTRIDADLRGRIIRRARRYHASAGLTLNEAAARLSRRYGRGHETIRQILAHADPPIFHEHGPLSTRQRRLIFRAWQRSIEPGRIAQRVGRSRGSVHRVVNEQRARLLRGLDLQPHVGPMFDRDDAGAALLTHPAVTGVGLEHRATTDLSAFLAEARATRTPGKAEESALATAQHFLLYQSAGRIDRLGGAWPSGAELDAIETALRWVARIRTRLMRRQFGLLVKTLSARLDGEPEQLGANRLAPLLGAVMAALADAAAGFDPFRGGRLAAPAGIAMDRAASAWIREHPGREPATARAAGIIRAGSTMPDWTRAVAPWQRWLEPDRRVQLVLGDLDAADRRVLVLRFGWGGPPSTLADLAQRLGTTPMHAAGLERRAIRAALGAARQRRL